MEQFERVKRYLSRIKNIYEGFSCGEGYGKKTLEDDVISFFIHCYHIRDWTIDLNKIGMTATDIDEFINQHVALRICADLANGSKHCELKRRSRTESQPHIVMKTYDSSTWLCGDAGQKIIKGKYIILSGEEFYDALELAEECVSLWSNFIEKMQNTYMKKDLTGAHNA
jgi:hypothetical protein